MTPTEQEIEFFKEAKRIQELWEPRVGDWFAYPKVGWKVAIVKGRDFAKRRRRAEQVWLPRPDQLWEMLEERGLKGGTWKVGRMTPPEKNAYLLADCEVSHDDQYIALCSQLPPRKPFFGPTPSIALGRALIEVMNDV